MRAQFATLLAARLFATVVQAATVIILGRLVGPVGYGSLNALLGVGLFLTVIADFGVTTFIARARAAGHVADVNDALRLNAGTSALSAVLIAIAASVYVWQGAPPALFCIPVALALEKNVDAAMSVPIADGAKGMPATSAVMRRVVTLALFLGLAAIDTEPLLAYGFAYIAGSLAAQIQLRVWLSRHANTAMGGRVRFSMLSRLTPFAINNIAVQSRSLDTAIVGALLSPAVAGAYAAAQRVTGPFSLIPSTLTSLILPHATRARPSQMRQYLMRLVAAAIAFEIVVIPAAFFSTPIVVLLFGPEYSNAGPVLAVALVALPVISLASPLGSVLQARGREKFVAWNGVVFAGVTLGAIALGAIFGGASGVAFAIGVAYLLKCGSCAVAIWRLNGD